MPEKWGGLYRLRDVTGRINIIQSLFFPRSSARENKLRVSKNILGEIFRSIC